MNDSPHSSQIVDQTISEHCPIEDNPDCSQQVHEVLIDFSDPYDYNESFFSDDMYYLVSSKTISLIESDNKLEFKLFIPKLSGHSLPLFLIIFRPCPGVVIHALF